jgi:hypothetical protein
MMVHVQVFATWTWTNMFLLEPTQKIDHGTFARYRSETMTIKKTFLNSSSCSLSGQVDFY